ncbi:MAG: transposase [Acidobacteriales bacterium]|nr:transposase [Terriglobales bacterium]
MEIILKEASFGAEISAVVVMPDHVHILMAARDLSRAVKRIKGVSARRCNLLTNHRGTVWQADSFVESVKNTEQYDGYLKYIVRNPVLAGLTTKSADYRWLWLR